MKSKTTIQISKALRDKLRKLREYDRQSYDELLKKKLLDKKTTLGKGT